VVRRIGIGLGLGIGIGIGQQRELVLGVERP
jgi:hypothetical protein